MQDHYNEIWLIAASEGVQLRRLMRREGLTIEQAHARLAAQMPLDKKSALAHAVILTDEGKGAMYRQIDGLLGY